MQNKKNIKQLLKNILDFKKKLTSVGMASFEEIYNKFINKVS